MDEKGQEEPELSEQEIQKKYLSSARAAAGDRKDLLINGELTSVNYTYANCCNPIPGDEVIGFISRNGEVKIHRSNCNNAYHLIQTDGERIIDVEWAKNIDTKFLGAIKVIGEDRVGLVNDITDVLSKSMKTNMKSINVNSDSGMFEGILTVYIDDLKHLERIIEKVKRVEGVKDASRYE